MLRDHTVLSNRGRLLHVLAHGGWVRALAFSPDGQMLASGSADGTVRLWDPALGRQLYNLAHENWVTTLAFSLDGHLLASGSADRTVRLWDPATGRSLHRFAHENVVTTLAFSPDGRLLASGSVDGMVQLLDPATSRQRYRLTHEGSVTGLAFSPDGRLLASGSQDRTVRLWDPATGRLRQRLAHEGSVTALAFSPDGRLLASGSRDSTVRVWDLATGRLLHMLAHEDGVLTLAFSADGRLLASGSWDRRVRLWDPVSGRLRHTLPHDNVVNTLTFSPDGRLLISGSWDRTVRLWDLASSRSLSDLAHDNWVTALAVNPDGRLLVSGSRDGTVRLWDLILPWPSKSKHRWSEDQMEIDPETLQPLPRFFGMPLTGRVSTIEVHRLRFEFLLNHAVVYDDRQRPARDWLQEQRLLTEAEAEGVLRDEQICETREARLAIAIAQSQDRFRAVEAEDGDFAPSETDWAALEEARYSIWGGLLEDEGERRWTPDRYEDGLSRQARDILPALRNEFQKALTPAYRRAELNLRRRSLEWTQRISELPADEFPLHFPTLPWEGVLGEYGWKAQQILLYRPMIDWVARDLARETRLSPNTATSWLGALVMAHEATHAVIHLGMDAAGRWWQNPGKASLAFHESLAQWMARAWLAREIDADGRKVLAAVERRLPAVYHLDAVLPDVLHPGALEAVRYWLLARDENLVLPDILDVARRVLAHAIIASESVGPPIPEVARELDALATRTPPDLVDIKKMIDLLTRWAWPGIVASDPELLALLATPHQLACAAFVSACQASQSAGDTLRILTVADMQKHADALVFRHREAELNDLVVQLRHLRELQRLVQAGQSVASASLAVPEVSRQ